MTAADQLQLDEFVADVFQVVFVKNSEEIEQKFLEQNVAKFTSEGIMIQLDFSDPLLVS